MDSLNTVHKTATAEGLSTAEAEARLARDGYNEIHGSSRRRTFDIAMSVAREPMFLLLILAAVIYLTLGDVREALILAFWILVIMGITIFQERKTERALEALRDLSSPRALVVRDGAQQRIAGREVVGGDLLVLTEGDRVSADAVLHSCNDLMVDESLLTGEAVPVRKVAWDGSRAVSRPGGDDLPFVYAGTMLVQGRGIATVIATGPRTEIGRIGKALESVETDETFLQRNSGSLIRNLAAAGLSVCALTVILYGLTRGSWINGFLVGIALAMALLPEEIPVVLTVFFALGAWRMSQRRVLTRRMPAVEALGSVTVLCVDKTGTLTLNRMTVERLCVMGEHYRVEAGSTVALPQKFHRLVRYSVLASETDPFDPMEKAYKELGERYLDHGFRYEGWTLAHEYSITPELLALSHVWRSATGGAYVIAAKGAPEAVAGLCHLDSENKRKLAAEVDAMASDGLRVLAVAKAEFTGDAWPASQHDFDFDFLGLIGLADPLRAAVPGAIEECRQAGVKVVMITGDYPSTARAIGRKIGLVSNDGILTGPELDALPEGELRRRIATDPIFARVLPEQKLRLVEAFKANRQVVAMTGDGVNDAPALKAAHIGIAMGGRGTDVAREAASLVLLDDDFSTIVEAIRSGRRIFDNVQKAITFIFAVHVPIAGLALLPLILDWPLVLSPVHIVFLELVIDPACSVAFEAEPPEADIMRKPPRAADTPLFDARNIFFSLSQGILVLGAVLAIFAFALHRGLGDADARTLSFSTLVVGMLGLIVVNRSRSRRIIHALRSPNRAFWWVVAGAIGFLAAALYVPSLRDLFRFSVLHPDDLLICTGAGLLSSLAIELLKSTRFGK
jgi:Ca2+-transporting ATPase